MASRILSGRSLQKGRLPRAAWALPLILLVGCDVGDRAGGSRTLSPGEEAYLAPQEGGNTFACATCHAIEEPSADGLTRAGHPIGDAPLRSSFKNGQLDSFLDAANVCLETWMGVRDAWTPESETFLALQDYLLLESEERGLTGETLAFEIVAPPEMSVLEQGDPVAGRELFHRTCIVCHGLEGAGTERAPQITGFGFAVETIARRVRTSGSALSVIYPGLTGGRMPFWAEDRLSDEEVADLAAFVSSSPPPPDGQGVPDGGVDGTPSEPPDLPPVLNCAATHPRVGQSLALGTFAHQVSGTVTVIDDCTLRFTNFSYDGRGINVQIYGGAGANFEQGFSMTQDLRRSYPYEEAAFDVNLPVGYTLDDFDGVSVWCVPAAASFGDGMF